MKKNIVKICTLALLIMITAALSVAGLTACGDKEAEQIYITNNHTPRLNYVKGQDLDISGGILTAVIGGEETLVPMTSEGVTVTGYDNTKLGAQTVTVTYQGQTTTFTVNVIDRIVAENFEKGYFIDDTFKADKGRLRIAKDDATVFTVNMSDKRVSLKSFDSSSAGQKTVTVTYSDGTVSYDCSFTVEVYDASNVSIVYPNKTSYFSHDTIDDLDFSGGYLTVKAGTGGSLVKHINITKDMVSGFDPSLATIEHRDTPLSQKLTIKYLDKTFEYTVTIKYSSVSIIYDMLPILENVDLSGEEIVMTDEQKNAAYEAMNEYFKLSTRDKALVLENDVTRIARCATKAINELYFEALKECENTIAVNDNGQILLVAKTPEDVEFAIEMLGDKKSMVNLYTDVLANMKSEFTETEYVGEKTIAESLLFIEKEQLKNIVTMLEHMVNIHGLLSAVPEDWTVETLVDYKEAIEDTYKAISLENFAAAGNGMIYNAVSKWRGEKDDFFEIIYSYYMYVEENKDDEEHIKKDLLSKIPLPRAASVWYTKYYNAMYISQRLYQSAANSYLADVTQFMYYHNLFLEACVEILENEEDTLTTDIYNLMDGTLMIEALRTQFCGYYYHSGILTRSENFINLWESYLDLIELYATGKLTDTEAQKYVFEGNEAAFEAVLEDMAMLSPSELYGFLSSLNFLYNNARENILVLSKYEDKGYLNTLTMLLNAYYDETLSDDAYGAFTKLMEAIECFALVSKNPERLDDFKSAMAEIKETYEDFSDADRAAFDNNFGALYTKHLAIYNFYLDSADVTLDAEVEELFTTLYDTVLRIIELNDYIGSFADDGEGEEDDENENEEEADGEQIAPGTYALIFALYEKANVYYNAIVNASEENNDVLMLLYTKTYTVLEKEFTLDFAHHTVGGIFWYYVSNISLSATDADGNAKTYNAYDLYSTTNLHVYLGFMADIMDAQHKGDFTAITDEIFLSSIDALHGLNRSSVSILRAFGGNTLFFDGIEAYLTKTLSEDAETSAFALKLVDAARAYLEYALSGRAEAETEAFKGLMVELIAMREELSATENFEKYLEKFYNNYVDLYDKVLNPDEDPDDGGDTPNLDPDLNPDVNPDVDPDLDPDVDPDAKPDTDPDLNPDDDTTIVP